MSTTPATITYRWSGPLPASVTTQLAALAALEARAYEDGMREHADCLLRRIEWIVAEFDPVEHTITGNAR